MYAVSCANPVDHILLGSLHRSIVGKSKWKSGLGLPIEKQMKWKQIIIALYK